MNPKRIFRLATMGDLPVIMRLIDEARAIMRSCGNVNQWIDGYPSEETRKYMRAIGSMTLPIMWCIAWRARRRVMASSMM